MHAGSSDLMRSRELYGAQVCWFQGALPALRDRAGLPRRSWLGRGLINAQPGFIWMTELEISGRTRLTNERVAIIPMQRPPVGLCVFGFSAAMQCGSMAWALPVSWASAADTFNASASNEIDIK